MKSPFLLAADSRGAGNDKFNILRILDMPPGLQAAKSAESAEVIYYCPPTLGFDRNRIFILLSNLLSVNKSIAYSDGPF